MPLSQAELLEKFNPANMQNLTEEDKKIMRELTDAELKVLAQAYPNQPARRAYITLFNTQVQPDRQLFPLSTWQNLYNNRFIQKMKNLIPYDVPNNLKMTRQALRAQRVTIPAPAPGRRVIDMTPKEAAQELQKALLDESPAQTAPVVGQIEGNLMTSTDGATWIPGSAEQEEGTPAAGTQIADGSQGLPPVETKGKPGRKAKTQQVDPPAGTPPDQELQTFD